jgi:hypothetical protein
MKSPANKLSIFLIISMLCAVSFSVQGQSGGMQFTLDKEKNTYARLTFLNQIWVRYNQNNPGSLVDGYPEDRTFDIGLRRTRIQLYGQLNEKVFFYTQYGINNFTYQGPRKTGLFFHDALMELQVAPEKLSVGTGLTGWGGLSRYASPSVGSILTADAPLYQQATNDVSDQFLRSLALYAKGKLGKLDYRIGLTKPMLVGQSTVQSKNISDFALFSPLPPKPQVRGYVMYQFLDQEGSTTPYTTGSYLGQKKVFNLGIGFTSQRDAMWRSVGRDTLHSNLELFALDLFYDSPLNKATGTAITVYASYSFNNYGSNYLRNLGVMNPVSSSSRSDILNGAGNSFPMIGSGTTLYLQAGYLMKRDLLKSWGTLQPYAALQYSRLERLGEPMAMYEAGFNWLINGHQSKLSFNYQSRPVYERDDAGAWGISSRKAMWVMQWQMSI